MSKFKIPTIIAIIILLIGAGAGIFLIQRMQVFKLGASPEEAPKDVRIGNIGATSFTVAWVTDKPTISNLVWGKSPDPDETTIVSSTEKNVHFVEINNLTPATTYYFKINSAGSDYDNSGIPWQLTTGQSLTAAQSTRVIAGTVLRANGQPASEAIVSVAAGGMSPMLAKTTTNGGWFIPIGNARTTNLAAYFQIQDRTPILEIFVQGGANGVAAAQIYPASANPVPDIILGQTYDFRNEPENNVLDNIPDADINLPEDEATASSGFEVGDEVATTSAKSVTLESIENKEIVTTTKPEFFGEGPPGTKITITVESEVQTKQITIGSSGDWTWSPPAGLDPGEHSVTITWLDAAGILRSLTRTFVVQASEGPAFESTPSATATPKATASATASPTATPRVSLPATDTAVPESGTLTPTLVLFTMGLGLLASSVILWKKA